MKKRLIMWVLLLLFVLVSELAFADYILEPMGTFEFGAGIDGNFDEFTSENPKADISTGVMYFTCLCGEKHDADTIETRYSVCSVPEFKYTFTYTPKERRLWTEGRKTHLDEGYELVCTPIDGETTQAGEYPLTFRLEAKCGENGKWYGAQCTIPVFVKGLNDVESENESQWNEEYREKRGELIWEIDYSKDIVYKLDDDGQVVWFIQKALGELKYYDGDTSGHFGPRTQEAVKAFQLAQKLPVTGDCDMQTMARIFRLYLGNTEMAYEDTFLNPLWNEQTKQELKQVGVLPGGVIKLVDLWTDLSLNVELVSVDGHIDAKPVTANDTRVLCRMYGASDSEQLKEMIEMGTYPYQGRPMLLVVSHGGTITQIACSVDAMPHGVREMSDNEFIGSFCIYLNGSVIHGTEKTNAGHQLMIEEAVRLMGEKKGCRISIGDVVKEQETFENMPRVEVPTLVMPDGAVREASMLIKYDKSQGKGTIVYNVHMSSLEGEALTLLERCKLYFPYPEGMDENSEGKVRIIIHHQIDEKNTEVFKSEDGEIEFTKQGLCIEVWSFSPFEISIDAGDEYAELPQTGDTSVPVTFLLLLMMAAVCGFGALAKRRYN